KIILLFKEGLPGRIPVASCKVMNSSISGLELDNVTQISSERGGHSLPRDRFGSDWIRSHEPREFRNTHKYDVSKLDWILLIRCLIVSLDAPGSDHSLPVVEMFDNTDG
ncbi:unnamed protein product, partial [Choristocarpus tenellus]